MEKIKKNLINLYNNIFKKYLEKRFIIIAIVITIITTFSVKRFITTPDFIKLVNEINFVIPSMTSKIVNDILFLVAVILLGTVPYMYAAYPIIPLIAIQHAFNMVTLKLTVANSNNFILLTSSMFRIIGFSLVISYSIVVCKKSTKKFKLLSAKGYNFQDFKKEIYTITNKNEKIMKIEKEKKEKINKLEKELNEIKINKKISIMIGIITFVLLVISDILEKFI